jgi:exosortase
MAMTSSRRVEQILAAVLLLALLGAYLPALVDVVLRWTHDPKYSHGYLVPVFAAWLLWRRLRRADYTISFAGRPAYWGLFLLAAGLACHLAGVYFYVDWFAEASLLISLAGLCACLGGWLLLRLAAPSIAFLAFMLPLPYQVEAALTGPLQTLATQASTFLLQMLGFTASCAGNVITMEAGQVGVVDACSGLGMMVTFFALTTAVAIVIDRSWLEKVIIVASAVPVALAANITRITVTGVLFQVKGKYWADLVFHDLAGYLMMSFALLLVGLELLLLSRLLVEAREERTESLGIEMNFAPSPGSFPRG